MSLPGGCAQSRLPSMNKSSQSSALQRQPVFLSLSTPPKRQRQFIRFPNIGPTQVLHMPPSDGQCPVTQLGHMAAREKPTGAGSIKIRVKLQIQAR